MRSVKEIVMVKPRNLYGREFRVGTLFEGDYAITYKITKIPENVESARYIGINDEAYCWVEWELDTGGTNGVDYMWRTVIENIEDGTWVLI